MIKNEEKGYFKPGQSGNPKGRPKGSVSIVALLKKYLDKEIDFTDPITQERVKKSLGDVVTLKLIANAIKGDQRAIKEIADRIDGGVNSLNINNTNQVTDIKIGWKTGNNDRLPTSDVPERDSRLPEEI